MATVRILSEETRGAHLARTGDAIGLAGRLPRLAIEARRIATGALHGIHGRRRAGVGENFWQFRAFMNGEPAQRIDWRRSARDDGRHFVREREWEAAHTVWLWIDRSRSMDFESSLARAPKIDRAIVLGLALADCLVRGGERVGLHQFADVDRVEFGVAGSRGERRPGRVDRRDCRRAAARGDDAERAGVREHVQHAAALRQ